MNRPFWWKTFGWAGVFIATSELLRFLDDGEWWMILIAAFAVIGFALVVDHGNRLDRGDGS